MVMIGIFNDWHPADRSLKQIPWQMRVPPPLSYSILWSWSYTCYGGQATCS